MAECSIGLKVFSLTLDPVESFHLSCGHQRGRLLHFALRRMVSGRRDSRDSSCERFSLFRRGRTWADLRTNRSAFSQGQTGSERCLNITVAWTTYPEIAEHGDQPRQQAVNHRQPRRRADDSRLRVYPDPALGRNVQSMQA